MPNIIRMFKSRMVRSARHLACIGETRTVYTLSFPKLKKRHQLKYLGADGGILQWNITKWIVRVCTGFIWFRIGTCGELY